MSKYLEMFKQDDNIDLGSINWDETSFEDRYWILANKSVEFYTKEDRFLAAVCISRIKELAFLNACARQIDKCGFLDEQYKPYAIEFSFPPSNEKLVNVDRWVNGSVQRMKKLNYISIAVFIFAIGLIALLHYAFKMDLLPSFAIGVLVSVIGNSIVLPTLAKKAPKNKTPDVLKGDVPTPIKDLINFDASANEIVKNPDYIPLLKARNEGELNEAIRNYPKK